MTTPSITDLTQEEIIARFDGVEVVLGQYEIDFILLAGSVAEDRYHSMSDIDIFVSCPNYFDLSAKEKIELFKKLNMDLYDLIKLGEIEVSFLENTPITVRFEVLRNGILLHEFKKGSYCLLKYRSMKEFYDFSIWLEQFYKYAEEN